LSGVVDALFARAESALLADMPDAAAAALEGVRRADPSSTRLKFLEAQLERAKAARAAKSDAAKPAMAASQPAAAPAGAAPASQSAPARAAPTELDSLLVIATARMQRGELLEPAGDSAFEYVNRAAEVNGGDARVAQARGKLAVALLDAARAALVGADLEQAGKLLTAARSLDADPEAVALIDVELVGAQNAVAERRHTEWLSQADTRLRNGALAKPAGDSALDYLRRLQNEQPSFAGLAAAWDRWNAALTAQARQAMDAHDWAAAEVALTDLEQGPRSGTAVAALREQLEVARLQEQYLATATPAGELRLLEAPPVVYPEDALRRNVEGWVELEFVVDGAGRPKDLTVVASEPSGRFEEAALAAVAMYRYAPFERSGHVYERRVRVRVRFALN
jgi:TonB family protein